MNQAARCTNRRRAAGLAALAAVLALPALAVEPQGRAPKDLATGLDALRADFNAARGMTRFLVVASPTCPACRHGVDVIRDRILARPEQPPWRGFGAVVEWGIRTGERAPRAVLIASAAATIAAVFGIAHLRLDTSLSRMRPDDHPSLRAEKNLVASFAVPLDTATVTVPGGSVADALDRADAVASALRAQAPEGSAVSTPSDWIVSGDRLTRRLAALGRRS